MSVLPDLSDAELSDGRYTELSRLGEGSMGVVYRALDARLGTVVVIKFPRAPADLTEAFNERFEREIQSLVRVSHPNVVGILDVGKHFDCPYVVMQYLGGGSLRERIYNESGVRTQLAIRSLKDWLLPIAKALDFVHVQQILHRDVKPANILFDSFGHAYLSDFGLVKILAEGAEARQADARDASLTAAGFLVGTPNYIAPEVVMGTVQDGRVDQFALAMTTYESLAGIIPVEGPTASATLVNQTAMKMPPLENYRSDVPKHLTMAILRGLAKNPEQRYRNCEEMAHASLSTLVPGPIVAVTATASSASAPVARPGGPPSRPMSNSANALPRTATVRKKVAAKPKDPSGIVSRGVNGRIPCPKCATVLVVQPEYGGRVARCATCSTRVLISKDANSLKVVAANYSSETNSGQSEKTGSHEIVELLGEKVFGLKMTREIAIGLAISLVLILFGTIYWMGLQSANQQLKDLKEKNKIEATQSRE